MTLVVTYGSTSLSFKLHLRDYLKVRENLCESDCDHLGSQLSRGKQMLYGWSKSLRIGICP